MGKFPTGHFSASADWEGAHRPSEKAIFPLKELPPLKILQTDWDRVNCGVSREPAESKPMKRNKAKALEELSREKLLQTFPAVFPLWQRFWSILVEVRRWNAPEKTLGDSVIWCNMCMWTSMLPPRTLQICLNPDHQIWRLSCTMAGFGIVLVMPWFQSFCPHLALANGNIVLMKDRFASVLVRQELRHQESSFCNWTSGD